MWVYEDACTLCQYLRVSGTLQTYRRALEGVRLEGAEQLAMAAAKVKVCLRKFVLPLHLFCMICNLLGQHRQQMSLLKIARQCLWT